MKYHRLANGSWLCIIRVTTSKNTEEFAGCGETRGDARKEALALFKRMEGAS